MFVKIFILFLLLLYCNHGIVNGYHVYQIMTSIYHKYYQLKINAFYLILYEIDESSIRGYHDIFYVNKTEIKPYGL